MGFGFYVCCKVDICWVKPPLLFKAGAFMGYEQFAMVVWISYSLSSWNNVCAMGDLVQVWCLNLERWSEPPYLANVYLVRPW